MSEQDHKIALLEAQIQNEREQAADAVRRAFAAGWNACQRDRLSCTVETAFVRWVGRQTDAKAVGNV